MKRFRDGPTSSGIPSARNRGKQLLLCMSGRGDKDMPTLQRTLLAEGAR